MSTRDDRDQDTEPGSDYGWTIMLDAGGDLATDSLKRLRRTYDVPAVVQALKVALSTPEGTDPLRPDYGLDYFQALGGTDADLRRAIHDCIGPNAAGIERVERIDDIEIDRRPGQRDDIDVTITVRLVDASVVEFTFGLRERSFRGASATRPG